MIKVFDTIDISKNGYLSNKDLLRFLNKTVKGAQFVVDDIESIFRRFNVDENSKGISYH